METPQNYIFVFGSNKAGRHGKGAALHAREYYDAQYGVGEGLTGRAYAIPTKDEDLKSLPLHEVRKHYQKFIQYAFDNPDKVFVLTPIGTGLAGNPFEDIKDMVRECATPANVVLSMSWLGDT